MLTKKELKEEKKINLKKALTVGLEERLKTFGIKFIEQDDVFIFKKGNKIIHSIKINKNLSCESRNFTLEKLGFKTKGLTTSHRSVRQVIDYAYVSCSQFLSYEKEATLNRLFLVKKT